MERRTLDADEIERVLRDVFRLPVEQISPYFEGDDSIQIVRILARTDDSYKPFEDVQAEIKTKLEQQARRDAATQVLTDLRAPDGEPAFDLVETKKPQHHANSGDVMA